MLYDGCHCCRQFQKKLLLIWWLFQAGHCHICVSCVFAASRSEDYFQSIRTLSQKRLPAYTVAEFGVKVFKCLVLLSTERPELDSCSLGSEGTYLTRFRCCSAGNGAILASSFTCSCT